MSVEYIGPEGTPTSAILQYAGTDEGTEVTNWRVADVKANAPTKGRSLSKKQREARIAIPVANLRKARIYVDM